MAYPELLTNIVAGLLVIGFGIIVGNIFSLISRKILQSFEVERIMKELGAGFPIEDFVSSLVKYVTYIVGLVWGLTFLDLETIILYMILFVILGLLIGFILLGFKDFIPNFIAGFFINFRKKLKKGDVVKIDSTEGKVIDMNMLEVRLKTGDGDVVVMPNVLIARNKIVVKKRRR
jgi:small conductance mechanosensitive channel